MRRPFRLPQQGVHRFDLRLVGAQHQRARAGGETLVAMVTHEGPEKNVRRALDLLEGSDNLTGGPMVLPILPN